MDNNLAFSLKLTAEDSIKNPESYMYFANLHMKKIHVGGYLMKNSFTSP